MLPRATPSLIRLLASLNRSHQRVVMLAATSFVATIAGSAGSRAVELTPVTPITECSTLPAMNFLGVEGAPARLDSAEVVTSESAASYCKVKGYVASDVRFEVRLPVTGWTQRFVMLGCGGYCGSVNADPKSGSQQRQTSGCAPLANGEMVTASSDLGHTGNTVFRPDGLWALGNPGAVVDFAYAGMHKATLITKALIKVYYGQAPAYSYFVGCSDGGREALQEAQRFPDDYDGIISGAPVIDEVTTNTVYHAWGARTNARSDGRPILTYDKIPALANAVTKACGDEGGFIQDPRACTFNVGTLLCKADDNSGCLTAEQIEVVRKLWEGPVDPDGTPLSARAMPIGSELAWIGTMVPKAGETKITLANSGDAQWSHDFPNYMSSFKSPTGITYQNMEFTKESFDKLHELSGLYDPTNPDLSAFATKGGKLLLWTGWADSGASPHMALNYYDAVRRTMGEDNAVKFLAMYTIPGVYHCNAGPRPSRQDFLTSLMSWVEDGRPPEKVVVEFMKDDKVSMSRPVYPYPSQVKYDGKGDVNVHTSYTRIDQPAGLQDQVEWIGLKNYRPGRAMWCDFKDAKLNCATR
jgi:hypothetical protein